MLNLRFAVVSGVTKMVAGGYIVDQAAVASCYFVLLIAYTLQLLVAREAQFQGTSVSARVSFHLFTWRCVAADLSTGLQRSCGRDCRHRLITRKRVYRGTKSACCVWENFKLSFIAWGSWFASSSLFATSTRTACGYVCRNTRYDFVYKFCTCVSVFTTTSFSFSFVPLWNFRLACHLLIPFLPFFLSYFLSFNAMCLLS